MLRKHSSATTPKKQASCKVKNFCRDIGSHLRTLEEDTPWLNKAELYNGIMKESFCQDMKLADSSIVFWDNCLERRARIYNLTARNAFKLHGTTPYTQVMVEEGDISNLCQCGWYEWCYYREHTAALPNSKEVLGRVLGPARGVGNKMCQWILKSNGNAVPRRLARPLQPAEQHSPIEQTKRSIFDFLIEER